MFRQFVAIVACAILVPLSASSQERIYDFSMTFSGLQNVGGFGQVTISGPLTFLGSSMTSSELSISANNGTAISFSDGYSFTGTLGQNNTFAEFSFASVLNLPDNPDLVAEGGPYVNTSRTLTAEYYGSGTIRVETARTESPPFGEFNTIAQYSFGNELVNTDSGETVSGNDPVAVPEINGGSLALVLFVLGTLGVYTVNRRKRAFGEHQAFA